jgi:4a-hydroxytetrahydrobiopterin dehydratase
MKKLTPKEIVLPLKKLPKWSNRGKTLFRTYSFDGFQKSIDFVKLIAKKAQKEDHHPAIDIRFDKVTLTLTTHDAGGLTEMDFSLAHIFDDVFIEFFEE